MARANLKHLLEDAEMRVQRGQRRLDRQRESVAALERADRDTTMAKRLLKILEKALTIHVADRDRLTKRQARTPR
jgi:hemerythrin